MQFHDLLGVHVLEYAFFAQSRLNGFHATFSKFRHISTLTWHLLRCSTPWQQCPQTTPHR